MPPPRPLVVVITGMSGAGRSTAIAALEDMGFFCIDNLPLALAVQSVGLCEKGGMWRVGLGIDVRMREMLGGFGDTLEAIQAGGTRDVQVVFLDASDETLLRRFSETRRPHPLDAVGSRGRGPAGALIEEIELERERLAHLRARATRVIDTTTLSVHDLRRTILGQFGPASGGAPRMATSILSFGFKFGVPSDADMVFDVRFLANPHFVPHLRPRPGTDPTVAAYVMETPEAQEMLARLIDTVSWVLPRVEREGKSYFTVAIGCTGGRHRSVALAEALGTALQAKTSHPLRISHRDLERSGIPSAPSQRRLVP
jgi:UPF0042 nucleotide-binding protein